MKKTNLSKQFLKDAKNRFTVRFSFKVMAYYGKYNLSKKAVDIDLVKIEPLAYQPGTAQATIDHITGRFPNQNPLGLEMVNVYNPSMSVGPMNSTQFMTGGP